MNISRSYAARIIQDYDEGKIFSVTFVKRGDGSLRTITGRKGVTIGVKGVGHKFDPSAKGLVGIFDLTKMAFRFINLETIRSIRIDGKEFEIWE